VQERKERMQDMEDLAYQKTIEMYESLKQQNPQKSKSDLIDETWLNTENFIAEFLKYSGVRERLAKEYYEIHVKAFIFNEKTNYSKKQFRSKQAITKIEREA
jgi:hypothetical protein